MFCDLAPAHTNIGGPGGGEWLYSREAIDLRANIEDLF